MDTNEPWLPRLLRAMTSWSVRNALALGGAEVIANNIWALKSGTIQDRTRKRFSLYLFLSCFFSSPEDEWLLITLSSHLQSRILKEPGRPRPAGESAAPSNDYLMRLRPPLSLLWANTGRKCASPWIVPDASIHLSACEFLPLALISLCVCQRQTVTRGPLLCTGIGSKLCHWDLLMSSVCYCILWHSANSVHPLLWCSFQPLNVETMTEILDQSIP